MLCCKPYRELAHTADLRLEIRGLTWKRLLKNGAAAVTDQITALNLVQRQKAVLLELTAPRREDLLVDFLKHILLLFEKEEFVTRTLDIKLATETQLIATARGEKFDPARHPFKTEIKAVTYHQLELTHNLLGWRARVIFDL